MGSEMCIRDSDRTGDMILSTLNNGETTPAAPTYGYMEGTSQAAPHVSAVVALMIAANPNLTPARIKEILKQSVNPAKCKTGCGTGIVDARKAVKAAKSA